MRNPCDLDYTILMDWVEKKASENPGMSISITSQEHGPLCGFVPNDPAGRMTFELDSKWFWPFSESV